ncbi:MAG: isochorismate synthase [Calditrichaeota bacterium]|nr:isochorismate synthase [Calditrichota bacterium]
MTDFEHARKSLREKIGNFQKDDKPNRNGIVSIRRLTQEFSSPDISGWLRQQSIYPRFFWSDRSVNMKWATSGAIRCISSDTEKFSQAAFQNMENILVRSDSDLRWIGGMRFQPEASADDIWRKMGKFRFIIPRFEIHQSGTEGLLVCNLESSADRSDKSDIIKHLDSWKTKKSFRLDGENEIRSRVEVPSYDKWNQMMENALQSIRADKYQKIVLARKSSFRFKKKLDPLKFLDIFQRSYSNSFCFYFQPDRNLSFLGVTPEMLYERRDRQIFCDAMAGTIMRGTDEDEDDLLGEDLLSSEKNIREHRWVVQYLENKLNDICEDWKKTDQETLLKLEFVQHILTRFEGNLKSEIDDFRIINDFHPTPAVAGFPREESLQNISRLENFDRGWYAAPIGWFSLKRAQFAVALRSAVLQSKKLTTYAGAGIVEGSQPEKEWQEIENKIMNYTQILKIL